MNHSPETQADTGRSVERIVRRRIVESGNERMESHRGDFETCPYCAQVIASKIWEKKAQTLVLSPRCWKSGNVSIISECPNCFELSWVHEHMNTFGWDSQIWPKAWKKAVAKREAAVKLTALRDWGAALCHRCKHLETGTVEYHAWRDCIIGTGPAETECPKFEALNPPNTKLSGGD
jgi:hypothetical protein